jgi:DHA2 family multidrug resistance protein
MFNLTRQLGGSLGIALMATLLGRFQRAEKAVLTEHVVRTAPDVQARLDMITQGLMAKGATLFAAKQQAIAILDRQVAAQASVLAFGKIYLLNGIMLLAALPLLLLWKTGRQRRAAGPAH